MESTSRYEVASLPVFISELTRINTREQIRREIRLCRDRGSRMSSCRSSRPEHKPTSQDLLQNVQKSRVVCSWDDVFAAQSWESTTRTSHHLRWRYSRVGISLGSIETCCGFVWFYVLSTKSQIWRQDPVVWSCCYSQNTRDVDCIKSEVFVWETKYQTRETLSLRDAVVDTWFFFDTSNMLWFSWNHHLRSQCRYPQSSLPHSHLDFHKLSDPKSLYDRCRC